jgi:hypothetical protein
LVLGCFVVQTYGTSTVSPAASPHPHGSNYYVINPPTGQDVSWPPPELEVRQHDPGQLQAAFINHMTTGRR